MERDSDPVSIIDVATNTITKTIEVGDGPGAIGFFLPRIGKDGTTGCVERVPTLSEWSVISLTRVLGAFSLLVFIRRKRAVEL